MKLKTILAVAFCSLITSCKLMDYKPLEEVKLITNKPSDVVIMIDQQGIEKKSNQFLPAQSGGIIGGIVSRSINNSREQDAADAITKINEATEKYNFPEYISETFKKRFTQEVTLPIRSFNTFYSFSEAKRYAKEHSPLFSPRFNVYDFKLTTDLSAFYFRMTLDANIHDKKTRKSVTAQSGVEAYADSSVIYSDQVFVFVPLEGYEKMTEEEKISKWSENNASHLLSAFELALNFATDITLSHFEKGRLPKTEGERKETYLFGIRFNLTDEPNRVFDGVSIYSSYKSYNGLTIAVLDKENMPKRKNTWTSL